MATIPVLDEASVSLVRERVRECGAQAGLPDKGVASLVTVASELAHNQLVHARGGQMAVRIVHRPGGPSGGSSDAGVEVVAADEGEGLIDPTHAIRGTGTSAKGLGIGLSGVLSLADEVDFDVRLCEGTCVWARKFATQVQRHSIGIYGRPIEGERVSGDDAGFLRHDGELLVAVADGLGHGPEARAASRVAIDAALESPRSPLDDVLETAHERLRKTRGSVLAVTRVSGDGKFEASVAGNVVAQVLGRHGTSRRLAGIARALGTQGPVRRGRIEHDALDGGREILALYSDGLNSQVVLSHNDAELRAHPIVLAQHLVARFASSRDDAIVAVVA